MGRLPVYNSIKEAEMASMIAKLDEAIAEVKKKFEAEQEKERVAVQKRADLDREIAVCREELVRLQGEYRALDTMKSREAAPATETPS